MERMERKPGILVVDDEQIVQESVKRILEEKGFLVDAAYRADQALQQLKQKTYDLVLTDLMMPGKDGMDVIKSVAGQYPETGVIMFTGYGTVDSAVESLKTGAIDFLPKPFTPEELTTVVQRAVDKVKKERHERRLNDTYFSVETALASSLDLREILNLICSSVIKFFNVKGSALLLFRRKNESLEIASTCGLTEEYIGKGLLDAKKSIPEVFSSGEPTVINESEFDVSLQYPAEARKEKISSIVSIPLKSRDSILGFLRIYSAEKKTFSDAEMNLLIKLGEKGAQALENAMAFQKMRTEIEEMKQLLPKSYENG
jgi:FixJ family two-component response regulator